MSLLARCTYLSWIICKYQTIEIKKSFRKIIKIIFFSGGGGGSNLTVTLKIKSNELKHWFSINVPR